GLLILRYAVAGSGPHLRIFSPDHYFDLMKLAVVVSPGSVVAQQVLMTQLCRDRGESALDIEQILGFERAPSGTGRESLHVQIRGPIALIQGLSDLVLRLRWANTPIIHYNGRRGWRPDLYSRRGRFRDADRSPIGTAHPWRQRNAAVDRERNF